MSKIRVQLLLLLLLLLYQNHAEFSVLFLGELTIQFRHDVAK